MRPCLFPNSQLLSLVRRRFFFTGASVPCFCNSRPFLTGGGGLALLCIPDETEPLLLEPEAGRPVGGEKNPLCDPPRS